MTHIADASFALHGTTPQFWMGLQAQYDLERAEDEARAELKRIAPMKRDAA
jgi:plasmid maintenance system antidote protein VapI